MKKNTSLKSAEKHLNDLFSDAYSFDEAVERFEYLTNKSRGHYCSKNKLSICYHNRTLGTLLRKLDPVAFHCSVNDLN